MPNRYVAFLRGINVGGNNKLPMKDLIALCEKLGAEDVSTYIQSGNILFSAKAPLAKQFSEKLSAAIAADFALKVPVVLRSAEDLLSVLQNNPYMRQKPDLKTLHVLFLADKPTAAGVQKLDAKRSPPDSFEVRGQDLYLCLPNGVGRSKLTNAYFDSTLKTISTLRNWNTVAKLCDLL